MTHSCRTQAAGLYGNPREILQFACDFASKFMDAKAADDDHIPMVHPR